MSVSFHKKTTRGLLVAGLLATVCFSGCAVTPLAYETTRSTDRRFAGFTTRPNETIKIQAKRLDGGWETLKFTATGDTALPGYGGVRYYYWLTDADVPEEFWQNYGYFEDAYYHGAKVRVVDSSGNVLYTYRKGVSSGELLGENPISLWNEKGNPEDYIWIWLKSSVHDPF